MVDYTIVGGGIVGLSTAMALGKRFPHATILLLEKESAWALHQTGRNSGVIHSGIYYKPGSLKASFARSGNSSMVAFCQEHGIAHEICGKVIVATDQAELPYLERLHQRGQENGLDVKRINRDEIRDIEPHVEGISGILVPSAGIVDYQQVAHTFARIIAQQGGELCLNAEVKSIENHGDHLVVHTSGRTFATRFLINCAGLHSDRIAKLGQARVPARIVPFRGEYYELKPERRYLVKNLVYPVPHPQFPFLGVHFTRMIGGDVHAGPNAVLSLKREGYRKTDANLRDIADVMTFGGFWKLAGRHWSDGAQEVVRSISKQAFVRSLQKLIPEIQADDLVPSQAGVRAQALRDDGTLIDDFLIVAGHRSVHVCNAPSPAATASIQIGQAVVEQIVAQAA
jgi:(S)-2-hydroxyglutarate dehydrogenase